MRRHKQRHVLFLLASCHCSLLLRISPPCSVVAAGHAAGDASRSSGAVEDSHSEWRGTGNDYLRRKRKRRTANRSNGSESQSSKDFHSAAVPAATTTNDEQSFFAVRFPNGDEQGKVVSTLLLLKEGGGDESGLLIPTANSSANENVRRGVGTTGVKEVGRRRTTTPKTKMASQADIREADDATEGSVGAVGILPPLKNRRTQQGCGGTCIRDFQQLRWTLENAWEGACIDICPVVYQVTGPPIRIRANFVTVMCRTSGNTYYDNRSCELRSPNNRIGRIVKGTGRNLRLVGITFSGGRTRSDFYVDPNNPNADCGSGVNGGAICLQGQGPHTIERCTFRDNYSGGSGGAVWSRTVVNLVDVDFINNEARFVGGTAVIGSGERSQIANTRASFNGSTNCPNGIWQVQSRVCQRLQQCQSTYYNNDPTINYYNDDDFDRQNFGVPVCGQDDLQNALQSGVGGTFTLCIGQTTIFSTVRVGRSGFTLNCRGSNQNCILNASFQGGPIMELMFGATNNIISGIRFFNGVNTGSPGNGGGLSVMGANNEIRSCDFRNNQALYGGGVYADFNSNTLLVGNTFSGNSAVIQGGAGYISTSFESGINTQGFSINTAGRGCFFFYDPGTGLCKGPSPIVRSSGSANDTSAGTVTPVDGMPDEDGEGEEEDFFSMQDEGEDFWFEPLSYDAR